MRSAEPTHRRTRTTMTTTTRVAGGMRRATLGAEVRAREGIFLAPDRAVPATIFIIFFVLRVRERLSVLVRMCVLHFFRTGKEKKKKKVFFSFLIFYEE
jgi:hypothetical protein